MDKVKTSTPYTEDYKQKCFITWYQMGKPSKFSVEVIDKLPEDEYGRKATHKMLSQWRDEMGWDWRADELDARALVQIDSQLVADKVLMLKEQASRGRELQTLGMKHLRSQGFDSAAAAVAAVVKGAEMEKGSRGLSEAILKISRMSEKDLKESIANKLLREAETEQLIEGDIIENKKETENEG